MDFIKKAANSAQGSENSNQNTTQGSDASGQKEDYVDKAFGLASKKAGYNVDRNTEEKITDAGRGCYEQATGSKVSDKISN